MIAQLAARRSHNPKVVSSILTHRMPLHTRMPYRSLLCELPPLLLLLLLPLLLLPLVRRPLRRSSSAGETSRSNDRKRHLWDSNPRGETPSA